MKQHISEEVGGNRVGTASALNVAKLTVNSVVFLATVPILLHVLGEEQYGVWILATSGLGMLGMCDLGAGLWVTKFVSEFAGNPGDRSGIGNVVSIATVIGLVCSVAAIIAIVFSTDYLISAFGIPSQLASRSQVAFAIMAIALPAVILRSIAMATLMGTLRYDLATALSVGFTVISSAAAVTLGLVSGSIEYVMLSYGVTCWLAGIVGYVILYRYISDFHLRVVKERLLWRRILRFSVFSTISSLSGVGFQYGDRLIVGAVLGPAAVAYYAICAGVAAKINQLAGALGHVAMPSVGILRAKGCQTAELARVLAVKSMRVNLLVAAASSVAVFVSVPFLHFWLQRDISHEVADVQVILILAYATFSMNSVAYYALTALEKIGLIATLALSGSCITLALIWYFSSSWGLIGAALGNFGFCITLTMNYMMGRYLQLAWYRILAPFGFPALALALALCCGFLVAGDGMWTSLSRGLIAVIVVSSTLLGVEWSFRRKRSWLQ